MPFNPQYLLASSQHPQHDLPPFRCAFSSSRPLFGVALRRRCFRCHLVAVPFLPSTSLSSSLLSFQKSRRPLPTSTLPASPLHRAVLLVTTADRLHGRARSSSSFPLLSRLVFQSSTSCFPLGNRSRTVVGEISRTRQPEGRRSSPPSAPVFASLLRS